MSRVNILLLVALVLSGMYLVRVSYEQRRLYAVTEKVKAENAKLKIEEFRLKAEREEQATNLRVDKVARERLHMRLATPEVTLYADTLPNIASEGAGL